MFLDAFLGFYFFSLGRVVLYTVLMVFSLPETRVKILAKNLVKKPRPNLVKNLAESPSDKLTEHLLLSFCC